MSSRHELEYLFGAIRFFTRLPVPRWVGHSSEALERSMRYFPAVGLIVGFIRALVFAVTSFFWPKALAELAGVAGGGCRRDEPPWLDRATQRDA